MAVSLRPMSADELGVFLSASRAGSIKESMIPRGLRVAAVCAMLLLLSSCGISGRTAKTAPTSQRTTVASTSPTTAAANVDYGKQYLAIVAPANAQLATFTRKVAALPVSATGADVQKLALPLIDAIRAANKKLLRASWPAGAMSDIHALVAGDNVVIGDLQSVVGKAAASLPAWEKQLGADGEKINGLVSIVRADLGLPPLQSTA
jgi:hypothetical protein